MCTDNCGGVTVFKGENGVGIVSTVDNGDGTFTITYTDGTTFTTSDLTGPTGATGATGPAGTIPGSGLNNYVARWTPDGATLGYGVIRDDGTSVAVNVTPNTDFRFAVAGTTLNGVQSTTTRTSTGSDTAFGVFGSSQGSGSSGLNIGVYGISANNTNINYGVHGACTSVGPGKNIGLYGIAQGSTTANYAIKLQDTTQAVGKVLTCMTSNGEANWQTPTTGKLTWNTVTGTNPTATLIANNGYVVRDTAGGGTTDLTLPSSGVVIGDVIKIIATKEGGGGALQIWRILEGRAADVIFYSFFDVFADSESVGVKSTSPLLTFNDLVSGSYNMWKNQTVTLTCIEDLGTGYAWEIELANGKMFS